ncbi:MAG: glycosyltransferase family 39 protein [Candidatus Falkowbacteria bacterium]
MVKFGKDIFWTRALLLTLAVIFFIMSASFNYLKQSSDFVKWNSPDETANYFFTKLYAETGDLRSYEKFNLTADDLIHPRSVRSDDGVLKPVSFLGMILLYGTIAKIVGVGVLPYLTPLLGAIGIISFYLLVKEIFSRKIALISAVLLTFFPPYIYYSARSFFHNVPFVVLAVMGFYFVARFLRQKDYEVTNHPLAKNKIVAQKFIWSALAGFFIGLALLTRTSEAIWLLPTLFVVWVCNLGRVDWFKFAIFFCFIWLALIPMFFWNQALYGSAFASGYSEMNTTVQSLVKTGVSGARPSAILTKVRDTIFYFGYNPKQSFKMAYHYFVEMFYWIFWPAVLGFLLLLFQIKKWKGRHYTYFIAAIPVVLILILYYGSWQFSDNPDPTRFTIGNSYTRYWLPVYLMAIPLASFFLFQFSRWFFRRSRFLHRVGLAFILGIIAVLSVNFVLFGSEEGLMYALNNNTIDRTIYDHVLAQTEPEAVIITRYHDKILWPERRVILGTLTDDNMNTYYGKLLKITPVYYFNFTFSEKDVKYLNDSKLIKFGFNIEPLDKIDSFSLYRLFASSTAVKK